MKTPSDSIDENTLQTQLGLLRDESFESHSDSELFARNLHRRLVEAGPPATGATRQRIWNRLVPRGAWLWPASGVLCGAATFALLALSSPENPGVQSAPLNAERTEDSDRLVGAYSVPASKVAVINLNFAADVSVENVTFEVALPEGLVFWSRGEALAERTFRWPGSLTAGDNIVPIAVRGEKPGLYRVTARAEVEGEAVEHQLLLEVQTEA